MKKDISLTSKEHIPDSHDERWDFHELIYPGKTIQEIKSQILKIANGQAIKPTKKQTKKVAISHISIEGGPKQQIGGSNNNKIQYEDSQYSNHSAQGIGFIRNYQDLEDLLQARLADLDQSFSPGKDSIDASPSSHSQAQQSRMEEEEPEPNSNSPRREHQMVNEMTGNEEEGSRERLSKNKKEPLWRETLTREEFVKKVKEIYRQELYNDIQALFYDTSFGITDHMRDRRLTLLQIELLYELTFNSQEKTIKLLGQDFVPSGQCLSTHKISIQDFFKAFESFRSAFFSLRRKVFKQNTKKINVKSLPLKKLQEILLNNFDERTDLASDLKEMIGKNQTTDLASDLKEMIRKYQDHDDPDKSPKTIPPPFLRHLEFCENFIKEGKMHILNLIKETAKRMFSKIMKQDLWFQRTSISFPFDKNGLNQYAYPIFFEECNRKYCKDLEDGKGKVDTANINRKIINANNSQIAKAKEWTFKYQTLNKESRQAIKEKVKEIKQKNKKEKPIKKKKQTGRLIQKPEEKKQGRRRQDQRMGMNSPQYQSSNQVRSRRSSFFFGLQSSNNLPFNQGDQWPMFDSSDPWLW